MSRKITFIIVERSYVIRSGLKKIITSFQETGFVKEFEDIHLIKKIIVKEQPNVLIINAKLIDEAPEIISEIRKISETIKLVVFVGTRRSHEDFPAFDLRIAVDEQKSLIIKKVQELISEIKTEKKDEFSEDLSEREKDVVKQIALGKTNKQIANVLFISPHTVITHRKNITGKLGIKTVSGLTVYAILNNLIKIEDAQ